ncbi:MAG: DinB family protein [Chitinophagaceae bacterium]|nr:DinB family protein [Chitinophagaceae bacterium]
MRMRSIELLEQLQADVRQLILTASHLQKEQVSVLTLQPAAGKWSVAQVLEHLNSYGRYYLPAIERSLAKSEATAAEWFKPGWIGNYFTKIMQPGNDGKLTNKFKAPKEHTPVLKLDVNTVIHTFLEQQHHLLNLLDEAKGKNIGRIRTPISISRVIKLKVGDTFRFLVAHEQRHFIQIRNVVSELKSTGASRSVTPLYRQVV